MAIFDSKGSPIDLDYGVENIVRGLCDGSLISDQDNPMLTLRCSRTHMKTFKELVDELRVSKGPPIKFDVLTPKVVDRLGTGLNTSGFPSIFPEVYTCLLSREVALDLIDKTHWSGLGLLGTSIGQLSVGHLGALNSNSPGVCTLYPTLFYVDFMPQPALSPGEVYLLSMPKVLNRDGSVNPEGFTTGMKSINSSPKRSRDQLIDQIKKLTGRYVCRGA